MVFLKIAKELKDFNDLDSIARSLKSIVRKIKSKPSLYLKTKVDYKDLIKDFKSLNFNSKEDLNLVIKKLFLFFNNKNIKPNQKDVDLTNKCKTKLKGL